MVFRTVTADLGDFEADPFDLAPIEAEIVRLVLSELKPFARTLYEEGNVPRGVDQHRRKRHAPRLHHFDVLRHHPPRLLAQRRGAGKERSRVPVVAHSQTDEIERGG